MRHHLRLRLQCSRRLAAGGGGKRNARVMRPERVEALDDLAVLDDLPRVRCDRWRSAGRIAWSIDGGRLAGVARTECQRQCLGAPDQLDQGPLVKTARQLKANGRAAAVEMMKKWYKCKNKRCERGERISKMSEVQN